MSSITTHVLDTSLGKPVQGVPVSLCLRERGAFGEIARATTDADGRVRQWLPNLQLGVGIYQLIFETAGYFRAASREAFYERITLEFCVDDSSQHYHLPVLLTSFGYTTYRGS